MVNCTRQTDCSTYISYKESISSRTTERKLKWLTEKWLIDPVRQTVLNIVTLCVELIKYIYLQ